MRWTAKSKKVQIELDRFQFYPFFSGLLDQDIVAMFALCAGGDLHPFPEQVETFRQAWFVAVTHMIKGTNVFRVVSNKDKFMSIFLLGILAQVSFALWVNIHFLRLLGSDMPQTAQNVLRLLHGDFGKGQRWLNDLHAKQFFDFVPMLFPDCFEHML